MSKIKLVDVDLPRQKPYCSFIIILSVCQVQYLEINKSNKCRWVSIKKRGSIQIVFWVYYCYEIMESNRFG